MMRDWAKRIASGDVRALARAATAIENREPGAEELLAELGRSGDKKPLVLGVTGAPGGDVVIRETVGVGQAEVAVAQLAAITVVVLVPGMGDDVQAFKAGIMEIADIFVINKADHPGVERVESEIQALLSLGRRTD